MLQRARLPITLVRSGQRQIPSPLRPAPTYL